MAARQGRFTKLLIKALRTDANTIADVPLTIQGLSGQTGDLLQALDSSGNVLAKITAAGAPTFAGATTLNGNVTIATAKTLAVTDADALTVGGKIVPQTFFVPFVIPAGAAAGDYDCSIPLPVACKIVSVYERHQTLGTDGGAVTLMVKKVPSGTAKAAGTDCLAAGISLKAANDTNQTPALHGTAANYTFALGDAVALVLTGTPTAVDGVSVMVQFQRV